LAADPVINPDIETVEWVIRLLERADAVKPGIGSKKARLWLTDQGKQLLAATDALRDAIREASPVAPLKAKAQQEPVPSATTVSPKSPPPLTAETVLDAFEELRRERFARNGIVPVFELRRLLAARHGPEAGSHAVLDPILKQMRREKRLRLIAIGDLSEATIEQLDDSVPGENETFFYLEAAHEYAGVR
jgi:hypothetical protein